MSKSKNTELSQDFEDKYNSPKIIKRIDGKYILFEIISVLNFEKGIFYTIKELAIRPGKSIRCFIEKNRSKLVKPITFVIFCSLIYTIAQQHLLNKDFLDQFGSGYSNAVGLKKSALVSILKWLKNNYGYTNILMSLFIALWIKVFFRKFKYNIFEILTLLLYVLGISSLIYSLFIIIDILTGYRLLYWGIIIGFIYSSWAIGEFYNKGKTLNYLKGASANLLGIITFYFISFIIGGTIDMIILNSN